MHARFALAAAVLLAGPALAQDGEGRRWRVGAGPQLVPAYPGADRMQVRPLIIVDRVRGDGEFAFEAPDQGGGFTLLRDERFAIGPSFGFEGRRRERDAGGVRGVGRTVELGGFVNFSPIPSFRIRGEARQGLGGHEGLVGIVSLDYLARDADRWLFSIGPRVTLSDKRYNRAFFSVTPESAARSGLPRFDSDGGIQAAGAAAGLLRQFGPRWGAYGYVKYDRLVGDPARSPVVRRYGDRNQFSGGVALTYTFATGRR